MILKDGTANRESHAHTRGLGCIERIEDPCYRVRVKPSSRIFNCYLHLTRVNVPGGDHQFSRPLTYSAHRFETIHDQIQHDLLQLHPIAENRKDITRKPRSDHHALSPCLIPDNSEHFLDGFIQVQLFSRHSPLCGQGPNVGDHVSSALPIANDVPDSFTDFVQIRRISG